MYDCIWSLTNFISKSWKDRAARATSKPKQERVLFWIFLRLNKVIEELCFLWLTYTYIPDQTNMYKFRISTNWSLELLAVILWTNPVSSSKGRGPWNPGRNLTVEWEAAGCMQSCKSRRREKQSFAISIVPCLFPVSRWQFLCRNKS